jgi:hypothetical protein
MNSEMHVKLVELALMCLPDECGKFWLPLKKELIIASNYPDYFAPAENSARKYLDLEPDWCEFTYVPLKGRMLPFHTCFNHFEITATASEMVAHWNEKTLVCYKDRLFENAAKFAGCVSHLIGDSGQPAHTCDDRILRRLFPQKDKCFTIHPVLESFSAGLNSINYQPKLLGASLSELNWRLLEELVCLNVSQAAEVIPLMQSVFEHDQKKAKASADRTMADCSKLFADWLYTIWHIANGTANIENNSFDLCALEPFEQENDMLFNYGGMIDHIPGRCPDELIGLKLGAVDGLHGVCLLPQMAPTFSDVRRAFVSYHIPSGVFKYFESEIGLNRNCMNETEAIFEIRLDGFTVFTSVAINQATPPLSVKVELGNSRCLTLYVRDVRKAPCTTKFFYPVFAAPRLTARLQPDKKVLPNNGIFRHRFRK